MGEFGPWHWLIVAAVFVLLFGAKKLPDAARSLGKSARILKTELKDIHKDDETPAPVTTVQQVEAAPVVAAPVIANPVVTAPVTTAAPSADSQSQPVTAGEPLARQ